MARYQFEEPLFLQFIVEKFVKFEEDMRNALIKFIDMKKQVKKSAYYQISIYNLPTINKIRELKTKSLGRLMSIHGTVTRTTDTKPELIKGSFKCNQCIEGIVYGVE
jgi:DNA replicative helicase MCM subunit Mcm2 (Cdc46/Mcm family)